MARTKAEAKAEAQAIEQRRSAQLATAERRNRYFIVGGVVAGILVALGFIVFGWYQTQIRPLGKTVLQVEDTKFSLAHLERRMRLEFDQSFQFTQGLTLGQLANVVLGELELEATLLEGAEQLEIFVTDEEVDAEVRARGNLADEVAANLFAQEFRRQVEASGLEPDEYRQFLRASLTQNRVLDYFAFFVPSEEPQVLIRWIVLDDEEQAKEAFLRLENGEDFAEVARQISIETSTSEEGGLVDWSPRGAFPSEAVENYLFEEAEPGVYSEVLASGQLFYILELVEQDDNRALDEGQRLVVANRELASWIDDVNDTLDIERDFTAEDATHISAN